MFICRSLLLILANSFHVLLVLSVNSTVNMAEPRLLCVFEQTTSGEVVLIVTASYWLLISLVYILPVCTLMTRVVFTLIGMTVVCWPDLLFAWFRQRYLDDRVYTLP